MKTYTLNFNGYWREANKGGIPSVPGIYLVYRCIYNRIANTVSLLELVYIGQSDNVKRRINEHSDTNDLGACLRQGEELCYSVAEIRIQDLGLVENALIFAQKPRMNAIGKKSYNYPDASFNIGGRCALLRYTSFNITNP